jgi:hypothetical protein
LRHLVFADEFLFDLFDGHHLARLDVEPPEHRTEGPLAQRVADLLFAKRNPQRLLISSNLVFENVVGVGGEGST